MAIRGQLKYVMYMFIYFHFDMILISFFHSQQSSSVELSPIASFPLPPTAAKG